VLGARWVGGPGQGLLGTHDCREKEAEGLRLIWWVVVHEMNKWPNGEKS